VLASAVSYSAPKNFVPLSTDKYRLVANRLVVFWWYGLPPVVADVLSVLSRVTEVASQHETSLEHRARTIHEPILEFVGAYHIFYNEGCLQSHFDLDGWGIGEA